MGQLRHKVPRTILLSHEQLAALKKLSEETRVSQQEYLREGVDLVLRKYARRRKRR